MRPKNDDRYKSQKPRSQLPSEHVKARHNPAIIRGTTKHTAAATQAASGQALPDNDLGSGMATPGPGKPFNGKGKGKVPEPINTKSFPLSWGFGRKQKVAPAPPLRELTLLELLSCRKHELFTPHQGEMEKRLTTASLTTHDHFPCEDVSGKCKVWSEFNFDGMLEKFPFLNQTVPVPNELGMLLLWTWSDCGNNSFIGPESPGFTFHNEAELHTSLDSHLLRYMRQYLRITFQRFGSELRRLSATPVTIRDGNFMKTIRQKKPDFGVYSESIRGA